MRRTDTSGTPSGTGIIETTDAATSDRHTTCNALSGGIACNSLPIPWRVQPKTSLAPLMLPAGDGAELVLPVGRIR
jgi:hypothetical protein